MWRAVRLYLEQSKWEERGQFGLLRGSKMSCRIRKKISINNNVKCCDIYVDIQIINKQKTKQIYLMYISILKLFPFQRFF